MASVDTTAAHSTNGHGAGAEIPVENPATGEVIAYVADLSPSGSPSSPSAGARPSPAGRRSASTGAHGSCCGCASG